jgi:hypothetical protein
VTTINWERLHGEPVEELVAALLVMANPSANQLTPAGGDGGVDVRVWTPDGFEVYQIKRYTRPLTTAQARAIERSWATFVEETLGTVPVASWTLVMPWNPSKQRLRWLESLTSGAGVPTRWMGRTQLDVLAASHPGVVNFYLGDGADRLQELMTQALTASSPISSDAEGVGLLEAGLERHRALATALSEVDPFYRYEITLRQGAIAEGNIWQLEHDHPSGAVFIAYRQLDATHYAEIRLFPRSPLSHVLRPIRTTMQFHPDDAQTVEAVRRFHLYGAPISDVPATTTKAEGPPGTVSTGSGLVSFMPSPRVASPLPELELRLLDGAGAVAHRFDLVDVEHSQGITGKGVRLAGWDRSHSVHVEALIGSGIELDSMNLATSEIAGKLPAEVLPAVRLGALIEPDSTLEIGVRNGRTLLGEWELGAAAANATRGRLWVQFIEALIEIQSHTFVRILVPADVTGEIFNEVTQAARLLRGEVLEMEWEELPMVVGEPQNWQPEPEFAILLRQPFTVDLAGQKIELDRMLLFHSPTARRADDSPEPIKPGDRILLAPGSQPKASIRVLEASDRESRLEIEQA